MEEKIDRMEKNINDLIDSVVAIKDNMATKDELTSGLAEAREDLGGKIGSVQRALDAAFERQSTLEVSISKIEAELHI
jgi:chromosome segregation ATPase